ncbi:growth-regulating factor 3 isoform X2 [Jatropha curcas]|uniref:growth-regulating factor 3 isoform X2 n=1 Tax=Jatropha curcas TaxID=180498 RepID=UPI0009D67C8F|nr:growth-regulating factor 3 isoform X2 [Jatropha curcas]
MDFSLKQWRNQHASEEQQEREQQQPSVKMPKLLLDTQKQPPPQQQQQNPSASSIAAPLSLFVPEPNSKISNLSALSDPATRFPSMGGSFFSLAQWQELELQALIYRYMLAGATVPPELLQPIKKSIIHSPYFLHHPLQHYSYYQPAWYWGRAAMDPEPGRCRRTDGKKWRCSRDVVAGQKYCERHVHRGRNRSRKPVEIPTPTSSTTTTTTTATAGGGSGVGSTGGAANAAAGFNSASPIVAPPLGAVTNETMFSFSGQSPSSDLLHLNNGCSDSKPEIKGLLGTQIEVTNRNDGHILRHFFDDWPRSHQEPDNARSNSSSMNSATCLTISMPGNSSSDVSLKLSTGNGEEPSGTRGNERDQLQVNWTGTWGTNHMASMGGPLAEALRSSTNSSPTSVLHHLTRGSISETTFVSS